MARFFHLARMMCFAIGTFAAMSLMSRAAESPGTVDEKKATEWATSLADAVQNAKPVTDLFDWNALTARCLQGVDLSDESLSSIRVAMRNSIEQDGGLIGQVRKEGIEGGSYKFIRVFKDKEGTRVKFRLLLSMGGAHFHDYLLSDEAGAVRALDVTLVAAGEDFTQVMRRHLLPLLAKEDKRLLPMLTENQIAFIKHFSDLMAMAQEINKKRPERVALIAARLPIEVRNEKNCILMELNAAQMLSDDKAQIEIIDRYRRLYPGNAAIDLHSIDYFVLNGNLPEALACAERFQKSMGEEAYMMSMVADLQWQNGQIKEAIDSINKAIQMEPDYVDAYRTRLDIAASQKDFVTVNLTLQRLVEDFDEEVDSDDMREDPLYEGFVKSPEFTDLVKFLESRKK